MKFSGVKVQDVSGMPEYYDPILNENGNEIKSGHLSEGMTVMIPDPFFGDVMQNGTVDAGSIFGGRATATSGNMRYHIELDPKRAIWVSSNIASSVFIQGLT